MKLWEKIRNAPGGPPAPVPHGTGRGPSWAVLIIAGAISWGVALWHALAVTGVITAPSAHQATGAVPGRPPMPDDMVVALIVLSLLGSTAPVVLAALHSHNAASVPMGRFKTFLTYVLLVMGMTLSFDAQTASMKLIFRDELAWVFPLLVDLSAFMALDTIIKGARGRTHGEVHRPAGESCGETSPQRSTPGAGEFTAKVTAPPPVDLTGTVSPVKSEGAAVTASPASTGAAGEARPVPSPPPPAAAPAAASRAPRPTKSTGKSTARKGTGKARQRRSAAPVKTFDIRDLTGDDLLRQVAVDFSDVPSDEISANKFRMAYRPIGTPAATTKFREWQALLKAPEGRDKFTRWQKLHRHRDSTQTPTAAPSPGSPDTASEPPTQVHRDAGEASG